MIRNIILNVWSKNILFHTNKLKKNPKLYHCVRWLNLQGELLFQNNAKVNVYNFPEDLQKIFMAWCSYKREYSARFFMTLFDVFYQVNHECFFPKGVLTFLNKNLKKIYLTILWIKQIMSFTLQGFSWLVLRRIWKKFISLFEMFWWFLLFIANSKTKVHDF